MRLIDAEEMKTGICFIIKDSKELVTSSVVRKAMLGLVDRIKTVDAAPVVHGRWMLHDEGLFPWFECSQCGSTGMATRFCAGCGAKMDGGEES